MRREQGTFSAGSRTEVESSLRVGIRKIVVEHLCQIHRGRVLYIVSPCMKERVERKSFAFPKIISLMAPGNGIAKLLRIQGEMGCLTRIESYSHCRWLL